MTGFLVILLIVCAVFGLCLLAMAVGVILRGKCFKSCGCGKITFRGVTIRCPGCTEGDDDAESADAGSRPERLKSAG